MNTVQEEDIRKFASSFTLGDDMRGATVAVTGATGLLGACMVRCLDALNRQHGLDINIIAVVRNEDKARHMFGEIPTLNYYVYDFASDGIFNPVEKPDYIVHFACPTASKYFVEHPVETMHVVLNGTETLLRYSAGNNVRGLVFVSSLEVYGVVYDDTELLTENRQGYLDIMSTRSSYPMAKRTAECMCHAYASQHGVNVMTGRLAQTFGAGVSKEDNRVFAQFARSITKGDDIVLFTKGELSHDYCYTTDAVSALLYIMLKGTKGEAYNIAADDTYMSVREMADYMCREFNPEVKVRIQIAEGMGFPPTTHMRLSTEKLRELGWVPKYDKHDMLEHLIRSFKE